MNLDDEFDAARRRINLKIDHSCRVAIGRLYGISKVDVERQMIREANWRIQALLGDVGRSLSSIGEAAARIPSLPYLGHVLIRKPGPIVAVCVGEDG